MRRCATKIKRETQGLLKDRPCKGEKTDKSKTVSFATTEQLKELDDNILLQVNGDELEHEIFGVASLIVKLKEILVEIDSVCTENAKNEVESRDAEANEDGSKHLASRIKSMKSMAVTLLYRSN